jgi:hypothetical protein
MKDYSGFDSMDRLPQAPDGCRVLFSSCKSETHTPRSGLKQLFRRLKTQYRTEKLDAKDDINLDNLSQPGILVLACPQEPFTTIEFEIIKKFVRNGGSLLLLLAEGGEARAGTNVNYLLEQFGISVNSDSVVRTVHYKYLHPKQVLVQDGVLNRAITEQQQQQQQQKGVADSEELGGSGKPAGCGLQFVYPYGASLSVQAPAVPILSTGRICYPINRPIGELLLGGGSAGQAAGSSPAPPPARLPLWLPPAEVIVAGVGGAPLAPERCDLTAGAGSLLQARCTARRAAAAWLYWAQCSCLTTAGWTRRATGAWRTGCSSGSGRWAARAGRVVQACCYPDPAVAWQGIGCSGTGMPCRLAAAIARGDYRLAPAQRLNLAAGTSRRRHLHALLAGLQAAAARGRRRIRGAERPQAAARHSLAGVAAQGLPAGALQLAPATAALCWAQAARARMVCILQAQGPTEVLCACNSSRRHA